MANYAQHVSVRKTPQSAAIPGREEEQVANSAGGYTFQLTPLQQAERFLILGAEGGTYYATERKLTVDNAKVLVGLLSDPDTCHAALDLIVKVARERRAPKQEPGLFALALACKHMPQSWRNKAYDAICDVCQTSTQLFTFLNYAKEIRGGVSGAGFKRGVRQWYESKAANGKLDYQLVKYRQRNGWTHGDAMRIAHPDLYGTNNNHRLAQFALGKLPDDASGGKLIDGFRAAQAATTPKAWVQVLRTFSGLPWEALPTQALNHREVWEELLPMMQPLALIRNLGKLSAMKMFDSNMSDTTKQALEGLSTDAIIQAKLHPMPLLIGSLAYQQGKGIKGALTWQPNGKLIEALDAGFHAAFRNVVPSGKNTLVALDISRSMDSGNIAGTFLTPRMGASALALQLYKTEPHTDIMAFASASGRYDPWSKGDFKNGIVRLNLKDPNLGVFVNSSQRLAAAMSGTDCALPMRAAKAERLQVDTFVVITDNETWAGNVHPCQALKDYRQASGRNAKLVVVGMTSTGFTIADPKDGGSLDVVGFDAATPQLIADFARG